MRNHRYSEAEVLEKARALIHLFAEKEIGAFLALLDDNFSWLGDYESLYMQGIPDFLSSIQEERSRPPAEIRQEEYKLLSHEHNLWAMCGRFTVVAAPADTATVHVTLVWRQSKGELKLLHAHGTHAKPLPPQDAQPDAPPKTAQSRFFERNQISAPQGAKTANQKINLRDINGNIHCLFADEIFYIKSDNKQCTFFLENSSFLVRTTLAQLTRPPFLLLHRSYLANARYIQSICRYQATLSNGTQLPIGKERYMALKQAL